MDGASNNSRQFGNIAIKPSIDAIQEFRSVQLLLIRVRPGGLGQSA